MGTRRRHLCRMDRRRFIHGNDAKSLKSLRAGQHFAGDPRTLIGGLIAVPPQTSDVQQHIGHAVIGHNETVTLGDIEPLDDARHLDDTAGGFISEGGFGPDTRFRRFCFDPVRRHDAWPPPLFCWRPTGASRILSKITPAFRRERTKMQHCAKSVIPCVQCECYAADGADTNGSRTVPMSSRTTRSAISSKSVGSRLMMTSIAPLRFAKRGSPAAGQTTSEEPIETKRSHDCARSCARRTAASGMAWPNEMVAVLMWPPQLGQSGAQPLPASM